jgi:deazaflavin-dependent oxidoreductase (nitroreductase family)
MTPPLEGSARGRWLPGDRAARAARLVTRVPWLQTRVSRLQAVALRASRGRIRRSFLFAGGMTVLSLTTTGRRSGQPRTTTVAYMRDGDNFVVTGVNLGSERPPNWVLNLEANPAAEIEVDGERIGVRARRASGEEGQRLWAHWLEKLPATASFQRISGREIPVIVLERSTHSGPV